DGTVRETARNCGDLELVMQPPRKNDIRLMLMLDVGGSMDPHTQLVSRLFSAAHRGGGFRELRSYYFHNCVYGKVYEDAQFERPVHVEELFRELDAQWYLVMVGDAWMHPGELTMTSGSFWAQTRGPSGLGWLAKLADRFPHSGWLNPEPERFWDAPSIHAIRALFRMFPLSLEGLDDLVRDLPNAPRPERRHLVREVLRES
ncbi:MAG: VWA containing CoxE family protein, partial [Nannocystaceae bacterium]